MSPTTLTEFQEEQSPALPAVSDLHRPQISIKEVLGVRFHAVTMHETLQLIDQFIDQKTPRQICLGNAYTIAFCQQSPMRDLINKTDLVLADGMSIVWGARWLGQRIPQRVAGPDLMMSLCERAEAKQYRIFLMGSSLENLRELKKVLLAHWPRLLEIEMYSPPLCDHLSAPETEAILHKVRQVKPDILFVGMSAPKQEKWIAQHLKDLGVPVCIGIGAAFDFISGRIPRAPKRLQDMGLEWLYRLYREPRRLWRRYLLGNAVFLSCLGAEWIRSMCLNIHRGPPRRHSDSSGDPR